MELHALHIIAYHYIISMWHVYTCGEWEREQNSHVPSFCRRGVSHQKWLSWPGQGLDSSPDAGAWQELLHPFLSLVGPATGGDNTKTDQRGTRSATESKNDTNNVMMRHKKRAAATHFAKTCWPILAICWVFIFEHRPRDLNKNRQRLRPMKLKAHVFFGVLVKLGNKFMVFEIPQMRFI